MGYAGMVSRDIIDKNKGIGGLAGWSPITPKIQYSDKEKKIAEKIGVTEIAEISNIETAVFWKKKIKENYNVERCQLLFKWRYVTEHRLNRLLMLKRNLMFQGSKISLDSSISELDRAHENILSLLAEESISVYRCGTEYMDNDFEKEYAEELLKRILEVFKYTNDETIVKDIVWDLKYLTAVIMNKKNDKEEYICSASEYVSFLKRMGLKFYEKECEECRIETIFADYKYCVVCGGCVNGC